MSLLLLLRRLWLLSEVEEVAGVVGVCVLVVYVIAQMVGVVLRTVEETEVEKVAVVLLTALVEVVLLPLVVSEQQRQALGEKGGEGKQIVVEVGVAVDAVARWGGCVLLKRVLCVCVCACVCAHTRVCISFHLYASRHRFPQRHKHAWLQKRAHPHPPTPTPIPPHPHTHTSTHIHTHTCTVDTAVHAASEEVITACHRNSTDLEMQVILNCLQNLTRNGRPAAELFRPKVRPTESAYKAFRPPECKYMLAHPHTHR